MKYFVLFFIFITSINTYSQNQYSINITIDDFPNSGVMLADFYGDKNNVIDTLITDERGSLSFSFDESKPAGMYRIFLPQNNFIDFIFNNENIILKTNIEYPMDSLVVVASVENKLYYDFLRADRNFMIKLELLSPLLSYFPKDDEFYSSARIKFLRTQQDRDTYILKTEQNFPDTYATKIILFQRNPLLASSLNDYEKTEFIRTHFFDKINFDDPELLRSDAYPNKLISYLTLYSNRNLSQDQLEDSFIKAIDNLMTKPFESTLVKEYVVQYLITGFEKYGFERVLVHMAETYKDDKECEDAERKSDLQTRLDNYKKLAEGKIAPDISVPDEKGDIINFSDIESKYTMVIFWATWCPHCTQMLPEIYELYKKQNVKNIEVLTISLDDDEGLWKEYLTQHNFDWLNASELKKWNSKSAIDYNIYATPTILLLDKNRKIISKPLTMHKIQQEFLTRK